MRHAFFYTILLGLFLFFEPCLAQENQPPLKSPEDIPQTPLQDLLAGLKTEQRGEKLYVEISVAELLHLTLKVNLSLVSLRLQEQEFRAKQIGAKGIFDFNLGLEAATITSTLATHGGNSGNVADDNSYLDISRSKKNTQRLVLSKPTRLGWKYQISHSRTTTDSTSYQVSNPGEQPDQGITRPIFYTQETEVRLTMPLRKGAGWKFNSIPLRRSYLEFTAQRLINRSREEQILTQVALLYWQMVGVQETLIARQQAVELSEQLLQDARTRFNVGALARQGVISAELRLASRKQEALQAELAVLEIESLLQALLNVSDLRIGLIAKDVAGEHSIKDLNRQELLAQVKQNHPELALLDTQLEQTRLNLLQAKNSSRTKLDLDLSYKQKGFGDSYSTSSRIHKPQNEQEVRLTWQIPLFGRKPKSDRQRYLLEEQRTFLGIKNKQTELEVSLLGILLELRLNKGGIAQAEAAEKLARTNLESEVQRFRVGRSTNTVVTQVQNEFTNTQLGTILAKTRFEESYLKLLALTGNLYDTFGLESTYAPEVKSNAVK